MDRQVIVVQAADLLQARRVIPDLEPVLCSYVAVLAPHQPTRLPELMSYQSLIARSSAKFRWPSWVVYDQNFRQEAAGNSHMSWAKADPSIYAQCFTKQAISAENWCDRCHSLDHSSVPPEKAALECCCSSLSTGWKGGRDLPKKIQAF